MVSHQVKNLQNCRCKIRTNHIVSFLQLKNTYQSKHSLADYCKEKIKLCIFLSITSWPLGQKPQFAAAREERMKERYVKQTLEYDPIL